MNYKKLTRKRRIKGINGKEKKQRLLEKQESYNRGERTQKENRKDGEKEIEVCEEIEKEKEALGQRSN